MRRTYIETEKTKDEFKKNYIGFFINGMLLLFAGKLASIEVTKSIVEGLLPAVLVAFIAGIYSTLLVAAFFKYSEEGIKEKKKLYIKEEEIDDEQEE